MDERGSWSSLVEPVITSRSSWPTWQECAVTVHKHAPIPCTDEMSPFRSLVKIGCCFCSPKIQDNSKQKWTTPKQTFGCMSCERRARSADQLSVCLMKVHFTVGLPEWYTFTSGKKPLLPLVYANTNDMEDTCYFSECKSWWGIKGVGAVVKLPGKHIWDKLWEICFSCG